MESLMVEGPSSIEALGQLIAAEEVSTQLVRGGGLKVALSM